MKFTEKIFSLEKQDYSKILTILGVKIKIADNFAMLKRISELCLKLYYQFIFNDSDIKSSPAYDNVFIEKFKNADLKDKYTNLIRGLDEESIDTVSLIISRCQQWNAGSRMFPATDKERIGLKKYACEFERNIIKLSDDTWAYKKYLLPEKSFDSAVFLDKNFIDRLENQDKIRNKNIIDVGGFIGDSALVFSKYTNKKIYSFEPLSKNFDKMQTTIELNSLNNVIPVKKGLGSREETAYIDVAGMFTKLVENDINTEKIQITTIDKFVKQNNIEIGLIKADIEGFEMEMLKGAKETLQTQRPSLLICIYHSFDDFFNIKTELESWNLGYKFKIAKPDDYSIYCDTTLIAEIEE